MVAVAVSHTTAQRSPLQTFRSASALSFLKMTRSFGMSDATKSSPSRWIATARFCRWKTYLFVSAAGIGVPPAQWHSPRPASTTRPTLYLIGRETSTLRSGNTATWLKFSAGRCFDDTPFLKGRDFAYQKSAPHCGISAGVARRQRIIIWEGLGAVRRDLPACRNRRPRGDA